MTLLLSLIINLLEHKSYVKHKKNDFMCKNTLLSVQIARTPTDRVIHAVVLARPDRSKQTQKMSWVFVIIFPGDGSHISFHSFIFIIITSLQRKPAIT